MNLTLKGTSELNATLYISCRGIALAASLALVPVVAAGQSPSGRWTSGAEVDAVSRYVWRGIPYSDGAVIQPSAWIAGRGFTFNVWSNFVAADEINRGTLDQVFITATWQRALGRLRIEPTLQGYSSRAAGGAGATTTIETAVRASIAAGRFRIVSTHTIDIGAFRGDYVGDAGVSRATAFGRRLEMTLQASVAWASAGFNEDYVGTRTRALNYAAAGVTATIRLDGPWYLRPHADVQRLLDADVRRALGVRTVTAAGLAIGRGY